MKPDKPSVRFEEPDKMHLVGYFIRSLVERNAATPDGQRVLSRMRGRILLDASGMQLTLFFDPSGLLLATGRQGKIQAQIRGSLSTLLEIALGKGMLGPVLTGKLKVGGRIWKLLPLLQLFQAKGKP